MVNEFYEGGEFMITEKMPHAAKHFFVEDELESEEFEEEQEAFQDFITNQKATQKKSFNQEKQ